MDRFAERQQRILDHHTIGEFAYPKLTEVEKHTIRVIAESLYKNVQAEVEKESGPLW